MIECADKIMKQKTHRFNMSLGFFRCGEYVLKWQVHINGSREKTVNSGVKRQLNTGATVCDISMERSNV